jgi:ferric-dicitrate binding protein FerR (iron transport regulator)
MYLIDRYLDDREALSADELDDLIEQLRDQPALAAELRDQLVLDDLLAQKLAVDRRNFQAQVGQRIADYEEGQEELDQQVQELRELAEAELERPQAWSGSSPWVKYVLALATAALIGGAFLAVRWTPQQPLLVAKVTAVEGPVRVRSGGQSLAAELNSGLLSGQQIVVPAGGSIAIAYQDETTVRLGGDSAVTFDVDRTTGAKRVAIAKGEVLADVRPQSDGAMTFATPHALATVLGTRLRLLVSQRQTLLDVTQGRVRLDRLDDEAAQIVAGHQTGLVTKETLHVRALEWPLRRDAVAFLLSPLETIDGLPLMAARNPASDNLRHTELQGRGSVRLRKDPVQWELEGGHLFSREAGPDILATLAESSELSLEIVFTPEPGDGTVVAFGDESSPNFSLSQQGRELVFTLRGAGDSSQSLRFPLHLESEPLEGPSRRRHVAITGCGGELIAFQGGAEVARSLPAGALFVDWREGPLTVGAQARGGPTWRGTVQALALYARCLSPDEVARSAASYRLLSDSGR